MYGRYVPYFRKELALPTKSLSDDKRKECDEVYADLAEKSVGYILGYRFTNLMAGGFHASWEARVTRDEDEDEVDIKEENLLYSFQKILKEKNLDVRYFAITKELSNAILKEVKFVKDFLKLPYWRRVLYAFEACVIECFHRSFRGLGYKDLSFMMIFLHNAIHYHMWQNDDSFHDSSCELVSGQYKAINPDHFKFSDFFCYS